MANGERKRPKDRKEVRASHASHTIRASQSTHLSWRRRLSRLPRGPWLAGLRGPELVVPALHVGLVPGLQDVGLLGLGERQSERVRERDGELGIRNEQATHGIGVLEEGKGREEKGGKRKGGKVRKDDGGLRGIRWERREHGGKGGESRERKERTGRERSEQGVKGNGKGTQAGMQAKQQNAVL